MQNGQYLQVFNYIFLFYLKINPTNILQLNLGSYLDDASVQAILYILTALLIGIDISFIHVFSPSSLSCGPRYFLNTDVFYRSQRIGTSCYIKFFFIHLLLSPLHSLSYYFGELSQLWQFVYVYSLLFLNFTKSDFLT